MVKRIRLFMVEQLGELASPPRERTSGFAAFGWPSCPFAAYGTNGTLLPSEAHSTCGGAGGPERRC